MTVWREEIFGPLLPVVRRKDYTEAVDLIQLVAWVRTWVQAALSP
jgi:acyl-CoA reductase-like NAD-dependent aldehyde dehydrogenase